MRAGAYGLGLVAALAAEGCATGAAARLEVASAASDHAADVLTLAGETLNDRVGREAEAGRARCLQDDRAARQACRDAAVDAAVEAARPAEHALAAVAEAQNALVDALETARRCLAQGKTACRSEAETRAVRLAAEIRSAIKHAVDLAK